MEWPAGPYSSMEFPYWTTRLFHQLLNKIIIIKTNVCTHFVTKFVPSSSVCPEKDLIDPDYIPGFVAPNFRAQRSVALGD